MKDLERFLSEDIGHGDITTKAVARREVLEAEMTAKEDCIIAGLEEAVEIFNRFGAEVQQTVKDGEEISKGSVVMKVKGPAEAILTPERLALNMVMRMSGIATMTSALVKKCREVNPKVRIAATRKTTPGFRYYEKKAVVLGGGDPHRYRLDDMILIKDNHIKMAGSIEEAVKRAKEHSFTKKIEVECETMEDALTALKAGTDIIMLDNMKPDLTELIYQELKHRSPKVIIEISGGIGPDNIVEYANCADVISLGALTHSVRSMDISLNVIDPEK